MTPYFKRSNIVVLLSLVFFLFTSCKKEGNFPIQYDHTVIVYIEANNNLKYEAYETLNRLEEAFYDNYNTNNQILVYVKDNARTAYLMRVAKDKHPYKIVSDTLKIYTSVGYSSSQDMNTVLTDIKHTYDSQLYSLVLWSHGTAWLPPAQDMYEEEMPKTKAFGDDRGYQMSIFDLKEALPMPFHYIMFDACAMSSIEVLYEFRDKAKYIISSPTDILSDGFPYHWIGKDLFAQNNSSLKNIGDKYIDYYNAQSGKAQSATLSIVNTSELKQLAETMYDIHVKHSATLSLSSEGVQRLDFIEGFPVPLYDFGSYVSKHFNNKEIEYINNSLEEVVFYKNRTSLFVGNAFKSFSGMSCYIPTAKEDPYLEYYKKFRWFNASGINKVLGY